MTEEQQKLEQAITNLDRVVGGFQCDRQARGIVETAWQLIVETARKVAQPKGKGDGAT